MARSGLHPRYETKNITIGGVEGYGVVDSKTGTVIGGLHKVLFDAVRAALAMNSLANGSIPKVSHRPRRRVPY